MLNRKISYDLDLLTDINKIHPFLMIANHPEKLNNDHLHLVSKLYMDRFLPPNKRNLFANFFYPHTNHPFAKKLADANIDSSHERWMMLANLIDALPNTHGYLAYTIINLFIAAFNKQIYTSIEGGREFVSIPKDLVVTQLKQLVNNYYLSKLSILPDLMAQLDKQEVPEHIATPY